MILFIDFIQVIDKKIGLYKIKYLAGIEPGGNDRESDYDYKRSILLVIIGTASTLTYVVFYTVVLHKETIQELDCYKKSMAQFPPDFIMLMDFDM